MRNELPFFDATDTRISIAKPYSHVYHVKVPEKFRGKTIENYYSTRFPYKKKDLWLNSIKQGKIKINGMPVKLETIIESDSIIDSLVENITEPPINPYWDTIYEDEDLIIINKPGHLAVHPTGRFYKHTILNILEQQYPDKQFYILHRLDIETSGLLILGKTKKLASLFFKLFQEKTIQKDYLALVKGKFPDEEQIVDAPIGKSIHSNIGVKMEVNGAEAKEARSVYSLVERRGEYSLIKCSPITGRTNQLRVHLEYINFPILGDKMYCKDDSIFNHYHENGETEWLKNQVILNRQALHAHKLRFFHPIKKEEMSFEAPYPEDINYYPKED